LPHAIGTTYFNDASVADASHALSGSQQQKTWHFLLGCFYQAFLISLSIYRNPETTATHRFLSLYFSKT
jgi:hypothetical protein